MIKIIVEYKVPITKANVKNDLIPCEEVKMASHEINNIDSSVSFRDGSLIILEKNGNVIGYSNRVYVRFWTKIEE